MHSGHLSLRFARNAATLRTLFAGCAIVELSTQGVFLDASPAFLKLTGYTRDELIGQHHRLLMPAKDRDTADYALFWQRLSQGESQPGEYHRINKNGQDIWLQASYMPVRRPNGKVIRIIKLAFDITEAHAKAIEDSAILRAINQSQAMISFTPDGTILKANEVFSKVMGYSQEEIRGRHHSLFVDPKFSRSDEYKKFWQRLAQGEFFVASWHRVAKNQQDVWLQASYNPVFDDTGKVVKVVKIASDITPLITGTRKINAALKALANGDLCTEIEQPLVELLEGIRSAFNESVAAMRHALSDVLTAADHIDDSSRAVNSSVDRLSNRTEQQAVSLEEAAASLGQITNSVQDLTDSTTRMRDMTSQTNKEAAASSHVIENAVHTMRDINDSSTQISNIIGVIDEIALQTNLLALNAGVEAARAGDAGRGFAVVATEVRALAQRSAEAAKEIKTLIDTSGRVVAQGVNSVTNARESLGLVADYIKTIDQSLDVAAVGIKEQSSALKQVGVAVNQIDKVTQENAAMAAETAVASQTLAEEAKVITKLLARFNVGRKDLRHTLSIVGARELQSAAG